MSNGDLPKILVVGSINLDLIVRAERLPRPGETVVGGTFSQAHGGKGANQAVAAARAGESKVAMLGAVGGDSFGNQARSALSQEGLDVTYVRTIDDAATGVAIISVDQAGQNAITVASGANARVTPADVESLPPAVWSQVKVVLVSLEIPIETAETALRLGKQHGTTTILNPAPVGNPQQVRPLLPLCDFVIPNETEAAALTGISLDENSSLESAWVDSALSQLLAAGTKVAILTLGKNGVAWRTTEAPNKTHRLAPPPVTAVDATAAGDALCGCFAMSVAEATPLAEALRFAVAGAAISVTRLGAQPSLAKRAEIDALLKDRW
jgi:ribokinase